MNLNYRGLWVVAGLALGLAPGRSVRADATVASGLPVVTVMEVPAQGAITNDGCATVDFADGSVRLIVVASPNSGSGGGVLARAGGEGLLVGASDSGVPYLGIILPFEGTLQCFPPNPCAPIMLQLVLLALAPPSLYPPNPCSKQTATGTLSLVFNADGTVQRARVNLNPQPLPP